MRTPSSAGDGKSIEPRTVYVSDALQVRLDTYRDYDADRTTTSVTFAAIERFRAELPELVRVSRARLASPVPDRVGVRYLGVGPVHIWLHPTASGAELLDRLSAELGLSWRHWVPPVLNAYLPGRREPENMPWLVQEEPSRK